MKRLILSLAAAAILAGPMAMAATVAHADPRDDHRDDGRRRNWERQHGRPAPDPRNTGRWDQGDKTYGRWDHGYGDWNQGRNNGYYYQNRWYYGPPPPAYTNTPGFRPGYTSWRRGSVLPPYYRGQVVNDYNRYHLRPPPRGYAWYRAGDDFLLAAVGSGLIFEIISGN